MLSMRDELGQGPKARARRRGGTPEGQAQLKLPLWREKFS